MHFVNFADCWLIRLIFFKESAEDKRTRLELIAKYSEKQEENENESHTNQFSFIERATQTKNNTKESTKSQTDPLPMYG